MGWKEEWVDLHIQETLRTLDPGKHGCGMGHTFLLTTHLPPTSVLTEAQQWQLIVWESVDVSMGMSCPHELPSYLVALHSTLPDYSLEAEDLSLNPNCIDFELHIPEKSFLSISISFIYTKEIIKSLSFPLLGVIWGSNEVKGAKVPCKP